MAHLAKMVEAQMIHMAKMVEAQMIHLAKFVEAQMILTAKLVEAQMINWEHGREMVVAKIIYLYNRRNWPVMK